MSQSHDTLKYYNKLINVVSLTDSVSPAGSLPDSCHTIRGV